MDFLFKYTIHFRQFLISLSLKEPSQPSLYILLFETKHIFKEN